MSTLIFAVKPEKIGGNGDISLILESLLQNEIDQRKTYEDTYEILYHLECLHLEEIVGRLKPVVVLKGNYFSCLKSLGETYTDKKEKIRFAAPFLTSAEVQKHIVEFAKLSRALKEDKNSAVAKRIGTIAKEVGSEKLIFEITNPTDGCVFEEVKEVEEEPVFTETAAVLLPEDAESTDGAIKALSKAVASAYAGKVEPVNLAIYSHVAITKALRHFLYRRRGKDGLSMPIGYPDGSQGRPFPLLTLPALPERSLASLRRLPIKPIGEITDRHPEMDILVQEYWFRNLVISIPRPMAETDEISYLYSKQHLEELRGKKIRIAFYQTGFEPAAIGFYRALAEELIKSREGSPWIEVISYFYDKWKFTYEVGESWA